MIQMRGADVLLKTLKLAGVRKIFALSGNHIMPIFDAAIGSGIDLIHVRHEAAAVHMADAWARMTGAVGVALVSGGQGHANAIGALCTAMAAESPVILLSGHAGLNELGLGAFQELRQADLAEPVSKMSETAQSAATLAQDLARAFQIARSGRPGPVHVSLPFDVLENRVDESAVNWPDASAFAPEPATFSEQTAQIVLDEIARASRPLIVAPPMLCSASGRTMIGALQQATGVPVVAMESPRGIHDPSLGAFAEVLAEADLIVLLGKQLDFTLRFGKAPVVHAQCRWIVIEPDRPLIDRVQKTQKERLAFFAIADAHSAIMALIAAANKTGAATRHETWLDTFMAAIAFRPAHWGKAQKAPDLPVHPAELCRQLQALLQRYPDAVFVSDGGEIGQWAQAIVQAPIRVINGVAGAIGPSIPFALAAQAARPNALVLAVLGDGTFGFHMAEFDTAVRYRLPFVAIVGNDSRWNAEYQLQVRTYGEPRAQGCTLMPGTRYDLVASALGGHGEFVTQAADLPAALDRALASGKPACINVLIESVAAPIVRRQ